MIALFGAFALLATAIVSNKVLLYALSPEFLVGIRMITASVLLMLYIVAKGDYKGIVSLVKKHFSILFTISCFTTFLSSNLKAYALGAMLSSKMAFFGTLDPFIAALCSYLFYGERLSSRKWLGLFIGFIGMMLLIGTTSKGEQSLMAFSVVSYPELAALGAITLSRFGWILAQDLLRKGVIKPAQLNSITMFLGGLFSLSIGIGFRVILDRGIGVGLSTALSRSKEMFKILSLEGLPLLAKWPLDLFSPSSQLGLFLFYTILVGNVFGLTWYAKLLKQYSATFVALAGFSIPLMVHILGWLFLEEPLSVTFFVACAITFGGMLLFFLDEKTGSVKSSQGF